MWSLETSHHLKSSGIHCKIYAFLGISKRVAALSWIDRGTLSVCHCLPIKLAPCHTETRNVPNLQPRTFDGMCSSENCSLKWRWCFPESITEKRTEMYFTKKTLGFWEVRLLNVETPPNVNEILKPALVLILMRSWHFDTDNFPDHSTTNPARFGCWSWWEGGPFWGVLVVFKLFLLNFHP